MAVATGWRCPRFFLLACGVTAVLKYEAMNTLEYRLQDATLSYISRLVEIEGLEENTALLKQLHYRRG